MIRKHYLRQPLQAFGGISLGFVSGRYVDSSDNTDCLFRLCANFKTLNDPDNKRIPRQRSEIKRRSII